MTILPAPSRPSRVASAAVAGSTLLPTLIVVAVVLGFVSAAASVTSQFGRIAARQQGVIDQTALADSALEYAYATLRTAVRTNAWIAPTSVTGISPNAFVTAYPAIAAYGKDASSGTLATGTSDNGLGITELKMTAWDLNKNAAATVTNGKIVGSQTQNVPSYPGWTGLTYGYKVDVTVTSAPASTVTSTATKEGSGSGRLGNPPAFHATRYFQMTTVPLFQAAIFYQNKLEIHPGAVMTVLGLVHSNGMLEAQGYQALTFKSNVSSVGTFLAGTDTAAAPNGWSGYTGQVSNPGASQTLTWTTSQASQYRQVSAIDPFGGTSTSNNGLHDMIEPPPTSGTDTFPTGMRAYNNASLRIQIDSSRPSNDPLQITITDGSGNALTTSTANLVKAAITVPYTGNSGNGNGSGNGSNTATTFYDGRETTNIRASTIDMSLLNTATAAMGSSFNGLIHARDVAPNVVGSNGVVTAKPALRLKNGRNMPRDTTIASDTPVYLQGDFNTGGSQPGDVPSNASNATTSSQNYANGYSRASCAIMADAVTVLSNNWNDANSNQNIMNTSFSASTGQRAATATTVNAAILAGDMPTNYKDLNTFGAAAGAQGNGASSGGVHNFTRFLENWGNVNFTYWGSLVEGFVSEKANGKWKTDQVYYWPNRLWNFDTLFLTNPPPGTPAPPIFNRGRWERY